MNGQRNGNCLLPKSLISLLLEVIEYPDREVEYVCMETFNLQNFNEIFQLSM